GPGVYVLPLHHPLRLIEEVCMLDHLSGGRLELGEITAMADRFLASDRPCG
ncbi:MAG TPA: LLM class flavin-dependent oxidoreductase, partial [Acidimicrobiales bacterium]|nr:LLM class flavin-dependent oxidoreductase [Acidimicrobiales bacterium]